MLDKEKLIQDLGVKEKILNDLMDRAFNSGMTGSYVLAVREIRWFRHALERGEYDLTDKEG